MTTRNDNDGGEERGYDPGPEPSGNGRDIAGYDPGPAPDDPETEQEPPADEEDSD